MTSILNYFLKIEFIEIPPVWKQKRKPMGLPLISVLKISLFGFVILELMGSFCAVVKTEFMELTRQ